MQPVGGVAALIGDLRRAGGIRFGCGGVRRQMERERGPDARRAARGQFAAVGLHDLARDRQPQPRPFVLVVKNGAKIFSCFSGGMPTPVSVKAISTMSVPGK